MKIPAMPQWMDAAKHAVKQHLPKLLTWGGVCGMVSTTVLAVSATPKACRKMEAETRKQGKPLTKLEVVKLCWTDYIPAAVTGAVSIACVLFADATHDKRNAALAAAYSLTDTAFKDYREKVVAAIGEKKEEAVRDEVAKEQIARSSVSRQQVLLTGQGNTLCLDSASGRYFYSDIDKLRRAANKLNVQLRNEMYVALNDFYDEIGLPHIDVGDLLGWNVDWGFIDLDFTAALADEQPCLVMSYSVRPEYNYFGR